MGIYKKIKYETLLLIIVTLVVLLPFNLDGALNDFFFILGNNLSNDYLNIFFIKITELGNSVWYFGICLFSLLSLFINKKINFINISAQDKIINFFVKAIIYLATIGLVTQFIKHLLGRPRPNHVNLENSFDFNFITFDSSFHSFPSGHSSTIFMVGFILCAILPNLKYFFYVMVSIIAVSRVVVGAHFFTDVLAGGLLALIVFKSFNYYFEKNYKVFIFHEILFNKNGIIFKLLIILSGVILFLTVGPTIDLYISGLFYHGESQFSLQSHYLLSFLFREILIPLILIYLLFLPILSKYINIGKIYFNHKFSISQILLIWTSQILSTVIAVNLLLKNLWGRARPGDVLEFGGNGVFTPWYKISDYCDTNCSFVSGDASVGFSIIMLYFITRNIFYFYCSLVFGFMLGSIRIIAGAHFISDVLFACAITLILNIIMYSFYKNYYDQ